MTSVEKDRQALIFEWAFDRYVYGIKRAEGAKVHAATEEDALIKAKYLFRVDFPCSIFILRSKKKANDYWNRKCRNVKSEEL